MFGERLNLLQWLGILLGFVSLFMISRIGQPRVSLFRRSRWLWMSIGATMLGAVSALYDKYLLRSYAPLEVQAWYSLYQVLIMGVILIVLARSGASGVRFRWRWSILESRCF